MLGVAITLGASVLALTGLMAFVIVVSSRRATTIEAKDAELRALDKAVSKANENTTAANAQLHETAHEFAEFKRRAEQQLASLNEEIDDVDQKFVEAVRNGLVRGAVATHFVDGLRRVREKAAARGSAGHGGAGAAGVSRGAPAGTEGGGG